MTSPALDSSGEIAAAPSASTPPGPRAAGEATVWQAIVEDWHRSSFFELVREIYFKFDRRVLGFTRIFLGFFLLTDLFHRTGVWMDMYSSKGVLPTHVNLQRPLAFGAWSFFNAFETPGELVGLWIVMFITYTCLFIGYKTKAAQILSLIFVVSMNGRVLLIENGGYVVHNLLLLWTCFLPLGSRFSLDAMLESMKNRREANEDDLNDRTGMIAEWRESPHYTLLGPVLWVQIGAIYFFNYIHKYGPSWKNGTAVHYVLYVDRMVTPITAVIRDHVPNWAALFMTRSTTTFELTLAFILFSPIAYVWCRRVVIFMMNTLHIAFGTAMVLGPFAWACCLFSTLLFSTADIEIAYATMRRPKRARTVLFDRNSGGALLVCRLLKRLDGFDLLTFRAVDDVEMGLRAIDDAGHESTWADAIADIVAALPLGPAIAWMFRAPGMRHVTNAVLVFIDGHDVSGFFGLKVPAHGFVAPPPSKVRRVFGFSLGTLREIGIAIMFAGAVNRALCELWCVNRRWHFTEPLSVLSLKLRFLQGWFMFSPNPVMDDGTIVVDAITKDGRHIDPFSDQPPNFDLLDVQSYGYSQIWCDYLNRIHLPANTAYREQMKDYMFRYQDRTGRDADTIMSGDVYWIQDMNPRWGETKSWKFEQLKLFSFERPGAKPPANAAPRPPSAAQPAAAPTNSTQLKLNEHPPGDDSGHGPSPP